MLHTYENTLQLTQLSHAAVSQLAPSFNGLPATDHADGQYRLRRYSVIEYQDNRIVDLQRNNFMQTSDINHFQGDVVRQFEPVEASVLNSQGFFEMCQRFAKARGLTAGQEIEVHQIRITSIYEETQVAPEGVHQDGFEHIAMIGIDRHNIQGGDIMLYSSENQAPFFRKMLDNGEIAILADNKLWHSASPISSVFPEQEGHMDLFVLTASEKKTSDKRVSQ